jgi:hypothetical protein
VRASLMQSELNEGLNFAMGQPPDAFTLFVGAAPLCTLHRPSEAFFAAQLPLVQSWAQLREERMAEILSQIDNQTAFIAAITGLNVQRHRWTFEWLGAALSLVIPVEVRFKHALGCHRPVEFSPQVQPIITSPGHGTYPMGHAAQAFMLADVVSDLLDLPPESVEQLRRLAVRISINRVVAGVHFPADAHAGEVLGKLMAQYFLAKCGRGSKTIEGIELLLDGDGTQFDYPSITSNPKRTTLEPFAVETGHLLPKLTELAQGEHSHLKRCDPKKSCQASQEHPT